MGTTTPALLLAALLVAAPQPPPSDPDPGRHLFVVADTSRSMRDTDPGRFAVVGTQIIAELLDEGDTLDVVRLADVDEFCTETGEMTRCDGSWSSERPHTHAGDTCHVCGYVPEQLEVLAEGRTLVHRLRGGEPVDQRALRRHLAYRRDATVYQPSLDAVAHRLPDDASAYLTVLTDGRPDAEFDPPAQEWTFERNLDLRHTAFLLLGHEATPPDDVVAQFQVRVKHTGTLLRALAKQYALSHGCTTVVEPVDDALELDFPVDVERVDVVLIASRRVVVGATDELGARVDARSGHNGYGIHFRVLRVESPRPGTHLLDVRAGTDAVAMILVHHDLAVVIDQAPAEVESGEPFTVAAHVERSGVPTSLPEDARVELRFDNEEPVPVVAVNADGTLVAEQVAHFPGTGRLQARLTNTAGYIHYSEAHIIGVRANLELGAVGTGTTRCLQPGWQETTWLVSDGYYWSRTPAPEGVTVWVDGSRAPNLVDSTEVSLLPGSHPSCSGNGPVCVNADLWAWPDGEQKVTGEARTARPPWYDPEFQHLPARIGPVTVTYQVQPELHAGHVATFLLPVLVLLLWVAHRPRPGRFQDGDRIAARVGDDGRWTLTPVRALGRAPIWPWARDVVEWFHGGERVRIEVGSAWSVRLWTEGPVMVQSPVGSECYAAAPVVVAGFGRVMRVGDLSFALLDSDQVDAFGAGRLVLPELPAPETEPTYALGPAARPGRWLLPFAWLGVTVASGLAAALFGPSTSGAAVFFFANSVMVVVGLAARAVASVPEWYRRGMWTSAPRDVSPVVRDAVTDIVRLGG